jgi:hypothetical protein
MDYAGRRYLEDHLAGSTRVDDLIPSEVEDWVEFEEKRMDNVLLTKTQDQLAV